MFAWSFVGDVTGDFVPKRQQDFPHRVVVLENARRTQDQQSSPVRRRAIPAEHLQMRGQFLLRRFGVETVDGDGTPRDGMAKLLCLLFSADGNLYFVRRKGVAIQADIVALQGVGKFVPRFQSVAFERVEDDVGPEETLVRIVESVVETAIVLALPWPRQIFREARRVSLVDLMPVGR